jgi:hypothetical protein
MRAFPEQPPNPEAIKAAGSQFACPSVVVAIPMLAGRRRSKLLTGDGGAPPGPLMRTASAIVVR